MASAAPVGTKGLVAPTEPLSSKRSANISASHLNSSLSDEALITDEEEEETDFGLNMHRILPNLWVGDYPASQKFDCLGQLGIKHIIAASKSKCPGPELRLSLLSG